MSETMHMLLNIDHSFYGWIAAAVLFIVGVLIAIVMAITTHRGLFVRILCLVIAVILVITTVAAGNAASNVKAEWIAQQEAETKAEAEAEAKRLEEENKAAAEDKPAASDAATNQAQEADKAEAADAASSEGTISGNELYPGENEGLLPPVDISVTEYRHYRKYKQDVATRGTRSENAQNKAWIADLNGYKCSDAVYYPVYMRDDFFGELNGVFPVKKYSELNGLDLTSDTVKKQALEKRYKADLEAWKQMTLQGKTDFAVDQIRTYIVNDPVYGIGWFEMLMTEEKIRKSYPEYYQSITDQINKAYSTEGKKEGEPVGVNCFLVYDTKEHAEQELEQYARTTEEYYREIAVPVCEILRVAFDPSIKIEKRKSVENMHMPATPLDNLCRLELADYQEHRMAIVFTNYGKHGEPRYHFGANTDDLRPEKFASIVVPPKTEEKGAAAPPKQDKKVTAQSTQTQPQESQPDNPGPDDTPDDDDDDDDHPKSKPPKDPEKEPTQKGTGGDELGGGNDDDSDGADEDTGDARAEEGEDSKGHTGGGGGSGSGGSGNGDSGGSGETGDSGNGDNESGNSGDGGGSSSSGGEESGNHDPGGNSDPVENQGEQKGSEDKGGNDQTTGGGKVNEGTVGDE